MFVLPPDFLLGIFHIMDDSFKTGNICTQFINDIPQVTDVSSVLCGLQLEVGAVGLLRLEFDVALLPLQHQLFVLLHQVGQLPLLVLGFRCRQPNVLILNTGTALK